MGVDFIDTAIALAKDRVPVDARRVFMSGWSNGAAMAMFYALNTDGIAGTSVYSAPDHRDSQNPCTQVPRPKAATPTQDIYNYCDLFGISKTGKYFYDDLRKRGPRLPVSFLVVDTLTTELKSRDGDAKCDPVCQSVCGLTEGTIAHQCWPQTRNSDIFALCVSTHSHARVPGVHPSSCSKAIACVCTESTHSFACGQPDPAR